MGRIHGNLERIPTLTCGLAAALVPGYIMQRFGLSPIVGYPLAGIAVVPNAPGFVANRVFAGAGEAALARVESLLRELGATSDQIDRERARARKDLLGGSDENGRP